jgi:two-component system CheB/CheR fusion protein
LREIARHGCVHLNKPVRAKELTRLAQRLLAKPHSPAPDSVQQLPLSGSTVFIVDDDRAVREAMRDLLQGNGMRWSFSPVARRSSKPIVSVAKDAFWSM